MLGLFPLKYLKGRYFSCSGVLESEDYSLETKIDCMDLGGDWVPSDLRWDNILRSTYNMFIISTCEGWSIIMITAWKTTHISMD